MIANSASVPTASVGGKTIRPVAAIALHGIVFDGERLLAVDSKNGYLLEIDPVTNNTHILNGQYWQEFIGATGLAVSDGQLWFSSGQYIYVCDLTGDDLKPEVFAWFDDPVNGVAVWESTVYITCHKQGKILVYGKDTRTLVASFYSPGLGVENITVRGEELWVSDDLEQSVYCLDRATGDIYFSLITPFENPTGLAFQTDRHTGKETLYVAYAHQEPYIRDNPNADPNHELMYRDRTFVHPLYFHFDADKRCAYSNGYLVEMRYAEELAPLDPVELKAVEWRMALPAETPRQRIRSIEPVGLPFSRIDEVNGQKVAVFVFDQLDINSRAVFGWRVEMEVWSVKYRIKPKDCEDLPELPAGFAEKYLVDNDDLSMGSDIIVRAAAEAIGRETNILRKMFNIRNYVYDHLSYGIKPHIDTPDLALRRGVGSCGEYVGVLLALARLNGIACRTAGRYKCPPQPLSRHLPMEPDFNHVWFEFYIPGIGWLPMESNPDDTNDGGPYPTRFFMGLAWYHAETAKDVPFEQLISQGLPVDKKRVSIGELAINHVQFTVLEELDPAKVLA
ncbi:MAG: transglutaminase domain-containing protein [Synechocystis sp.]|nr:transglutaminase domain-containing protein [Synechocystis sp.]